MTKDETLKLALELKNSASGYWTEKEISIIEKLIDALAQPQQEQESVAMADYMALMKKYVALKAAQPAQQEPVAWMKASDTEWSISFFKEDGYVPLYTTPPQRTWVSLTDEDRQAAFESMPDMLDGFLKTWGWLHFSKALEAKLKDKNK